ncbi:molybdopterin molybdotransferase MoeA [Flavobacterium zepuense]|uniref:Molybdopterin molybdenumtransferase n=1 Tax=Flavobacterium zepuense TaxID=2593302 RepID=A0A552V599_9FLAO|nr:gephyrin-like molybdotransferase Glp [Flavobacterium zepuense]TRW25653.1 molybdopterin molybdotransferase MoeA [Flavobacterium zepuense]
MISVQQAKQIIQDAALAPKIVKLPLSEAFGFTLAEDIIATVDIPNFAQSSMDGYAFKFADKDKPLSIIGEMAAGVANQLTIDTGQATRIFTGAPLPQGADTVIMQEKVAVENKLLTLQDDNLSFGLNVRPKGAEVKRGELAIAKETYLSAAALGFLAGIGCTHTHVYAAPKLAIILTGNELQEPGKPLEFGHVYEANSVILTAALHKAGINDITILRSDDNPETLTSVLKQALESNDVVLLNGGVSVGDYDYVVGATRACGVEQKFHKIKQKPGKPLFFGTKHDKLVFGLPGNPSSGLTCFYEYVLPALERSMHKQASVVVITATATHNYTKPAGLTHFLKAFYTEGKVTPLHAQESFRLHSFAQANCFIVLPEDSTGCTAGNTVEVHLLPL